MSLACVNGASVSIIPVIPAILLAVPVGVIPAKAQTQLNAGSQAVLVQKDIEDWAKTYISNYTGLPPFSTPMSGFVQGDKVTLSDLSKQTKTKGNPLVLQTTQITMTVKVMSGAIDPSTGNMDTMKQFDVKVVFTNAAQIKMTST